MARMSVRRGWLLVAILGVVGPISLVGCGGVKRVPVNGTVMMDGKPLNGAILTFAPDISKGNTAQISSKSPVTDGHYNLQTVGITRSDSGSGVPLGWYKVTVTAPNMNSKKRTRALAEIPGKYRSVEKTPLEVEVKDNPEPGAYDLKLSK